MVATIHQPSFRMLNHFDHLYIVASGMCMYQGPVGSLVSYFKSMNLNCPSYHNPADFGKIFSFFFQTVFFFIKIFKSNPCTFFSFPALDVASGEYGYVLEKLVSGIENGRKIYQETSMATSSEVLSNG